MFAKRGYLLDVERRTPNKRTHFELVDILSSYRYTEFSLMIKQTHGL